MSSSKEILEELKTLFAELRETVLSLRSEEERSHRERERMMSEWVEEARKIRMVLEDIKAMLEEVRSRFGL